MPDPILDPATTPAAAPESAAPATPPANETDKGAPADKAAALADKTPAKELADLVAKNDSLLGDDPDAKPAEGETNPDADGTNSEVKAGTVPEKYEVKAPEGMQIDTEMLDAVTPILKEKGFTQDEAQKLVDVYAAKVQQAAQKQHDVAMKQFNEQIEAWGKETKEMLGPEHAKALAPAVKFINTFGGKDAPAIRALLKETGLGNHKLIVGLLINAGKAIGQDSFVNGGNNPANDSPEAVRSRMYPTMGKK